MELLVGGYVAEYEFGFKKNGKRVVTWQYRVNASGDLGGGGVDDRAGGVYARAKVADATHFNFLSYSQKWRNLTPGARKAIKDRLPIRRIIRRAACRRQRLLDLRPDLLQRRRSRPSRRTFRPR